ncbi:MAG: glycosyltransferase family 4 protein [Thermoleophilia bacterium]
MATVGRRSGTPPLRPPLILGRCERCFMPMVRRSRDGERLCGSCVAGDRAIDQASRAVRVVRQQLYRAAGNVERLKASGLKMPVPSAPVDRPLRIALLAPPWLPVPPTGYGGIESVVALLADALVEAGHDVTLFAAPGSRSCANVVTPLNRLHPEEIGASVVEADHAARAFGHIERAAMEGRPFDVVHDHSGWVALAMADRLPGPVLHTVHGAFDDNAKRFYAAHGAKAAISCISRAQAATRPKGLRVDAVVGNPIDVGAWPTDQTKDDYLLWVGRFAPEKGAHRAIRVAKATGRRLVLAGPVQPGQEQFFAEAVEPHLDGDQIRYVGEIGGRRKLELFAGAYAFLMPITWEEPFGMVMVEAMAAGTPVIAFAQGSAPEVVEAGRSGLLVGDEEAMAEAVDDAADLSPAECRASVAERFSPEAVARAYERVYRAIAMPEASDGSDRIGEIEEVMAA